MKKTGKDYCKCGHHTRDHSYDPNENDAKLKCDICDCQEFKQSSGMKTIYKILIGVLILVIIAVTLYLVFKEPVKKNYDFPKDYTKIDCLDTFIGNRSGICFISFDNKSVVLKQGDYYEAYTQKGGNDNGTQ